MYDTLVLIFGSVLVLWAVAPRRQMAAGSIFESRQNKRIARLWAVAQRSMRENNLVQAEKALLTILSLDRKNAATYNRLGILYVKQKEYGDALECFTAAFNIEENASSLHNLGKVYFDLEQYEKASISFKRALELDRQSAIRYIEYARVLERLGRNKEVLENLEKAAELEPKPEVLKLLLKAYLARKMDSQAAAIEEKLKRLIISSSRQEHLQRSSRIMA